MSSKNQKRQRLIAFIFVNMIQYPRTLRNNIYHSEKQGTPSFFHPDTNPVIAHALVHFVDKTHILVVTVEVIWLLFLNSLSFNFVLTTLRFTRFRRSYVNHHTVVLTSYRQSYTPFLVNVCYSKQRRCFFCSCLFPVIVNLRC